MRKNNKQQSNQLIPIASVHNRKEYDLVLDGDSLKKIRCVEKELIVASKAESFLVDGYCVPCSKKTSFLVDMQSGGQRQDNGWLPNWRERLECPVCGMNNRQRLVATLIKQELDVQHKKHVYFMEQVTPIYNWATATFKNHNILGSEYLGHEYENGAIIDGLRHEDVENLSFPDGSLDLIVSNDVFEHVPNPGKAFAECARVLKADGVMLLTIPFHCNNDESISRAKIVNGQLEHVLPPLYHGNPISADGSLVFTDFGWDVLKEIRMSGFSDISVEVYASAKLGHLGGGQLVFRANKALDVDENIDGKCVARQVSEETPEKTSPLMAIMGEVLWHSLTVDTTIEDVSRKHLKNIKSIIKKYYRKPRSKRSLRILEVAAYAHTTGYLLAKETGAEVVLTDISVDTLALGKQTATPNELSNSNVKCVAADFHDLPFFDGQFDMVFIASALHHTWSWQTVLKDMIRVLAPGGLLYLENEPCLREFCFYKFRTNRLEQFRPLEQALKQKNLLRTIASIRRITAAPLYIKAENWSLGMP